MGRPRRGSGGSLCHAWVKPGRLRASWMKFERFWDFTRATLDVVMRRRSLARGPSAAHSELPERTQALRVASPETHLPRQRRSSSSHDSAVAPKRITASEQSVPSHRAAALSLKPFFKISAIGKDKLRKNNGKYYIEINQINCFWLVVV